MNRYLIISVMAATLCALPAASQTCTADCGLPEVLAAIEENNSSLQAARQEAEAEKLANRVENALPDPEIGFGYYWGGTSGDKITTSAMQTFDFATLSGRKSRLAESKSGLAEWKYRIERQEVLLEAKKCYYDITYYNAILNEFSRRKEYAQSMADGQRRKLESGECNRLVYNNVVLSLSFIKAEISRLEIERKAALATLRRLNGGEPVTVEAASFECADLIGSFEDWYALASLESPVLEYVRREIAVSKNELAVSRSANLPSLSAGYGSELTDSEKFRGITVGVSIPLWSNRKRVKSAQAAVNAAESRQAAAVQMFYGNMEVVYNRVVGLRDVAAAYREALEESDNSALLHKAMDAGAISVLDYLVEIGLYYDAVDQALSAERDYHQALAELSAFKL